jgi:hypothetical protein
MESNGTALVKPEYQGLVMITSPKEALRRYEELQAFVKEVMVKGLDYGIIPGTQRPTLLQPGAQKLEEIYGFAHVFEDAAKVEDWERGFFHYRKRAVITLRSDGRYIGDGIGSCNSKEARYAYRWAFENEVAKGIDKASLRSETRQGKNGKPYTRYRLPNEDIFSLVNTIEKMAAKRALVHGLIGATRSSGVFEQDLEDLPPEVFGEADESRSWQREQAADVATAKAKTHEEIARALMAKITAAKTEKELQAIAGEIGQSGLSKTYTASLFEQGNAKLRAIREAKPAATVAVPAEVKAEPKAAPAEAKKGPNREAGEVDEKELPPLDPDQGP